MLERLAIKGFLFIEDAVLSLGAGLNVITGETGAGKSLILGALNICLGGKIPKNIVNPRADYFSATLTFELQRQPLLIKAIHKQLHKKLPEVVIDTKLTFLTVLSKQGELHYFINQTPAPQEVLGELAEWLVDIHSQRQNQYLLKSVNHIHFFDAFIGTQALKQRYQKAYQIVRKLRFEWEDVLKNKQTWAEQKDFLQFTATELEQHLTGQEDYDELKARLRTLEESEKLTQQLLVFEKTARRAVEQATATCEALQQALKLMKMGTKKDSLYKTYQAGAASLTEHVSQLEQYLYALIKEIDRTDRSAEVDAVQQQLAGIEFLEKKYKLTPSELRQKYEVTQQKLAWLEKGDENMKHLEAQLSAASQQALALAQALHKRRLAGLEGFATRFEHELSQLGMEHGRLALQMKPQKDEKWTTARLQQRLNNDGFDKLEFYYAASGEMVVKPLKDIASGGELSRMMFALKTLLAAKILVGTMIFDEIDVGVGGLTAGKLARKLKELSTHKQLIVITHLPQLARVAEHHFSIEKRTSLHGETTTSITLLAEEAIVKEICRMLGRHPTAENLEFAKKFIVEEF